MIGREMVTASGLWLSRYNSSSHLPLIQDVQLPPFLFDSLLAFVFLPELPLLVQLLILIFVCFVHIEPCLSVGVL